MARSAPVIYQLFVRHFGVQNTKYVKGGTIEENGCGKFSDITNRALLSLQELGITHIWLTGVIEHATNTAYAHREADFSPLVKGQAGSPYAITDYFDVSADLAEVPEQRVEEFRSLLERIHELGMKVLIDFVPNHVARSYQSDVKPELSFGMNDDKSFFWNRENNFFYLQMGEGPMLLPPNSVEYEPEKIHGRVTGNNVASWQPSQTDWFETVKLNYGFDYTTGHGLAELNQISPDSEAVPDTWKKMREITQYWMKLGVDGFRADMAHMVPPVFWNWLTFQLRRRHPEAFFMAEGYAGDPMGCIDHDLKNLTEAGFNAVYDQDCYHSLKAVLEERADLSSLEAQFFNETGIAKGVRYLENHDEVRTAHSQHWSNPESNLAALAFAWLSSNGPAMIYNGQEVLQSSEEENAKTNIFEYLGLSELQKWIDNGRFSGAELSQEQILFKKALSRLTKMKKSLGSEDSFHCLNYLNPEFSRQRKVAFTRFNEGERVLVLISLGDNTEWPAVIYSPDGGVSVDRLDLICHLSERVKIYQ